MFKKIYEFICLFINCWSQDKVSTYSASLAYYTIFAITPLIIICINIIGFAFGHDLAEKQILENITRLIGQESANQIQTMIHHAKAPLTGPIAEIVSAVLLIIASSGIFSQIQLGLNEIWGIEGSHHGGILKFLKDRFLSFVLVIIISILLLASIIFTIILTFVSKYLEPYFHAQVATSWLLYPFVSLIGLTLIFALSYKILPDVKLKWSQVWMGSVISAILFTLGKFLLSLYLGTVHTESTFGPAGALIILLIWIYYSAQILFIGAEIIKIQALKKHKAITPTRSGVKVKQLS